MNTRRGSTLSHTLPCLSPLPSSQPHLTPNSASCIPTFGAMRVAFTPQTLANGAHESVVVKPLPACHCRRGERGAAPTVSRSPPQTPAHSSEMRGHRETFPSNYTGPLAPPRTFPAAEAQQAGLCCTVATGGRCCHSQALRRPGRSRARAAGSAGSWEHLGSQGPGPAPGNGEGEGARTQTSVFLHPESDFKIENINIHSARYHLSHWILLTSPVTGHRTAVSLSVPICEARRRQY